MAKRKKVPLNPLHGYDGIVNTQAVAHALRHLIQWLQKNAAPDSITGAIQADCLRKVAASFAQNLKRLELLAIMPFEVWHLSRQQEVFRQRERCAEDKEVASLMDEWQRSGHPEDPFPYFAEMQDRLEQLREQHERKLMPISSEESTAIEPRAALAFAAMDISRYVLAFEHMQTAMEALLASLVVSAWTAFETLAGDLWIAALNAHPQELAQLTGKPPRDMPKTKESFLALSSPGTSKKPVPTHMKLDFLQAHGYDLSGLMGTVLREKFNFQILGSIREAYTKAFDETHPSIREAILHPSLTALAATRNVLVHSAGIVDQAFLEDISLAQDFVRLFASVELNKPILLDGAVVDGLLQPALEQAVKLVREVDAFLAGGSAKKGV